MKNLALQIQQRLEQELDLTHAQSAGVLGNLIHESSLNPSAVGDKGASIGLAQWQGDRRKGLQQFAQSTGGHEGDLQTQIGFLVHELKNDEAPALGALKKSNSVDEATAAFSRKYERPGTPNMSARVGYARDLADGGNDNSGDVNYQSQSNVNPPMFYRGGKTKTMEPAMFSDDLFKTPPLGGGPIDTSGLKVAETASPDFLTQLASALGGGGGGKGGGGGGMDPGAIGGAIGTMAGGPVGGAIGAGLGSLGGDIIKGLMLMKTNKMAQQHASWLQGIAANPPHPGWVNRG